MKKLFYLFLGVIFLIPLERIGSLEVLSINLRISQILIIIIFFCYLIYCLAKGELKVKIHPSLFLYIVFLGIALVSIIFAREKVRGIIILTFLSFMFLVPYLTSVLVKFSRAMKFILN